MQNFYRNLEEYLKTSNMTKEEKAAFIKAATELYQKQVDKEYRDYVTKQRIGAGLEIASAAIPGGAGAKAASKIVPKVIQKTIGRKLSNDIASGAINGAISGGVYGFGEGLTNDKNPFVNSTQKATEGLITGGLISTPISKIQNNIRAKDTLSINEMRKYWGIPYRQASGDPQKAIETLMTYQKGFVPNVTNKNGIGRFDIPWGDEKSGLAHALMQRADQKNFDVTKFTNELPHTINNGIVTNGSLLHPETKNIISRNQKIAIAPNIQMANNLNRNWMVTTNPQNKSARKRFEDLTPIQNISSGNGSFSAPSIPELLAIDSINDYLLKNNPPKWVNPQTATLGQTINSNLQNNTPDFDFNTPITTRGNNTQQAKFDKIFTPEEIGKMSKEEFTKNEKVIMEQTKQGLIVPFTQRANNYSGYKNPISGDNRIFSQEDIGELKGEEFSSLEKEIDAQLKSIGIPTNGQLQLSDAIYVESYVRSDGTEVKGHYRSR